PLHGVRGRRLSWRLTPNAGKVVLPSIVASRDRPPVPPASALTEMVELPAPRQEVTCDRSSVPLLASNNMGGESVSSIVVKEGRANVPLIPALEETRTLPSLKEAR